MAVIGGVVVDLPFINREFSRSLYRQLLEENFEATNQIWLCESGRLVVIEVACLKISCCNVQYVWSVCERLSMD